MVETFLQLPGGIPTDDTFRRVFAGLDAADRAGDQWTSRRCGRQDSPPLGPLHLVTAFATENSLVLGQVGCREKSNEITAIPALLELLNIEKATVTIDRAPTRSGGRGCQKEIAAQIRRKKGHFVLGLKGHQPTLQADLQVLFDKAADRDIAGVNTFSTIEKDHGCKEERIVHTVPIPKDHLQRAQWTDLNTLVAVASRRVQQQQ